MAHFYSRFAFVSGILLGAVLALLFKKCYEFKSFTNFGVKQYIESRYDKWFERQGLRRKPIGWDRLRYTNSSFYLESELLKEKISVFCIILVKNEANLIASTDTWARGCQQIMPIYLYNSSRPMPIKRRKEQAPWFLLCNVLNGIKHNFDWVVVVNCNTFIVMENFRYFVASLTTKKPYYLGHAVKLWTNIYNTGQAGYSLNLRALKIFANSMGKHGCSASTQLNKEDFTLGKHLGALNITPIDTSDEKGLTTFYPYSWYHSFIPDESYYKSSVFPVRCCSRKTISFQVIDGSRMYTFYYLLYKLQIFSSGKFGNSPSSKLEPEDLVWKQFLNRQGVQRENVTAQEYYNLWEGVVNDPSSFARNMKKEQFSDYD
ncbi:glycoprotein-N-acetylgalactosamine 3-beta-galactosyltransferase 1-like [Cylas formicarius]|uniref:glycoprotein-N-acetylgalactosamine 3-beta-galactosyltransferase 1-like n=1 Tax=Cylas formicarius TaxID=197179 RepID=UPI002958A805|nr:glycoprotein-N-acetylgalactosamine 3-beta-galactosyltransferase 1-like [Cylas formicarius]